MSARSHHDKGQFFGTDGTSTWIEPELTLGDVAKISAQGIGTAPPLPPERVPARDIVPGQIIRYPDLRGDIHIDTVTRSEASNWAGGFETNRWWRLTTQDAWVESAASHCFEVVG